MYKWNLRIVADCTPKKSVGNCEKCLSEDQCIEGYCCPFMKVCVKTSSTTCYTSAQCTSACRDNMDQSECICSDKNFPEKWAKPTCGGTSHGGGNVSFQLVVKIIVAQKKKWSLI